MLRVLQLALAVCAAVYATVAVCGAWWAACRCDEAEPVLSLRIQKGFLPG